MTDVWRAEVYLRHADPRQRPVTDLLARVPDDAVATGGRVWDLGCGHGRLTAMAADRWPAASVIGIDFSADMLAAARRDHDRDTITWEHRDLLARDPEHLLDLVVANASLHWVDDHGRVFPRLVSWLKVGGTLAVQMPRNHDAPTHRIIADLVRQDRWRERLQPALRPYPVAPARWLDDLLRPQVTSLEVWETTYIHALTGDDPVLEWVSGSVLRPLLALLSDDEQHDFTTAAASAYRTAYPRGTDGVTLLPFTRQFLIATR